MLHFCWRSTQWSRSFWNVYLRFMETRYGSYFPCSRVADFVFLLCQFVQWCVNAVIVPLDQMEEVLLLFLFFKRSYAYSMHLIYLIFKCNMFFVLERNAENKSFWKINVFGFVGCSTERKNYAKMFSHDHTRFTLQLYAFCYAFIQSNLRCINDTACMFINSCIPGNQYL